METFFQGIYQKAVPIHNATPVLRPLQEWELRKVGDHLEVTVVFSGVVTDKQLRENGKPMEMPIPGSLVPIVHAVVREARKSTKMQSGFPACVTANACHALPE